MSGAKFKIGEFYKHRNDCCDFIRIRGIYQDSGIRADVFVDVCTQDHKGWRVLTSEISINISKSHYLKWESYLPRGVFRED